MLKVAIQWAIYDPRLCYLIIGEYSPLDLA